MRELVLSFRSLFRLGKLDALDFWIKRAQNADLHAMTQFIRTLKQDLSAVEAAVTEPWGNGPVEGHINRLKTLKRQMYGRAGLQLLLARLLPEESSLLVNRITKPEPEPNRVQRDSRPATLGTIKNDGWFTVPTIESVYPYLDLYYKMQFYQCHMPSSSSCTAH
jgi:Transposase